MSDADFDKAKIDYRPAQADEAVQAGSLIFETFPKLAIYVFGLGDEERAVQILADLFAVKGHRFSYQFTEMVIHEEEVIGLMIAYPGDELSRLNWRMGKALLKFYSLPEMFRLLNRGLALLFIKEAAVDEYLLSNLAVEASDRSRGVGTQILAYFESKAKDEGYGKVSLMVELDNTDAQRFYERNGYHVTAKHLMAEKHQPALGAGYVRMVKELAD